MGGTTIVKRPEGEGRVEPPLAFEPEISGFLAWTQLERGLADNTTSSYELDLAQCACFLADRGVQDWRSVEADDVSAWEPVSSAPPAIEAEPTEDAQSAKSKSATDAYNQINDFSDELALAGCNSCRILECRCPIA